MLFCPWLVSYFLIYLFIYLCISCCLAIMPTWLFVLWFLMFPNLRESWVFWKSQGVQCKRVARSINSVGLYVPGGTAVLPSTALMLAVVSWIDISVPLMPFNVLQFWYCNLYICIYLVRISWRLIILFTSLHKLQDVKLLFLQILQLGMALHARYLSIFVWKL